MNGWATSTCCTDGEHVFAWFGKGGAHCYTLDGKHVWSRTDLGEFVSGTHRGTASSPIIDANLLIINGDSESDHALFGLDRLTGKTVWKTDRPQWEGYSTPVPLAINGRCEIALNGEGFVAGYDPATGKQLWKCKSFAGRGEPLPAVGDGVIYVVNGLAGDMYAVKPGGTGDVTSTNMVWHTPRRGGRDGSSPLLVNGYLVVVNMAGIGACYDAATGKELWKTRVGGKLSGSPIAAGKLAYFLFEDGETVIIEPGPEIKEIGRNKVGAAESEIFRASPVPWHGHLLLRSDHVLYCVGGDKAQANAGGGK
jgi:outer membrane protein assembly factor BamB